MKNVLCYLGIMFGILLIALPPVLRKVLPDKKEEKKVVVENSVLLCTSDTYMVSTNYEGNKPTMIMLKKLNTNSDEADSIDDQMGALYSSLEEDDEVVYTEMDDGQLAKIDLVVLSHSKLSTLNLMTNEVNLQKDYYESMNLICGIR